MEAMELLSKCPEYHIIKFEVDKLHSLCTSNHYDGSAIHQYIFKVFSAETIEKLLELYEILCTIKPVFEPAKSISSDKYGIFSLFSQIFSILIYSGRHN